jgi:hypothetical protein
VINIFWRNRNRNVGKNVSIKQSLTRLFWHCKQSKEKKEGKKLRITVNVFVVVAPLTFFYVAS